MALVITAFQGIYETWVSVSYALSCSVNYPFKGTVSVIKINPPCKDDDARFPTVPLKP